MNKTQKQWSDFFWVVSLVLVGCSTRLRKLSPLTGFFPKNYLESLPFIEMFHKMFQSFKRISVNSSVRPITIVAFFVRMLPSLRAGAMTWSDLIGWSVPGPRPDLFRRASWCPPATVSGPAGPARRCAIMAAIMAVSGGAREKSISHRSPVHSSRKADRRIPASPHPHIPAPSHLVADPGFCQLAYLPRQTPSWPCHHLPSCGVFLIICGGRPSRWVKAHAMIG